MSLGRIALIVLGFANSVCAEPLLLWSLGVNGDSLSTPPQPDHHVRFILDLQSSVAPMGEPFALVSPFFGATTDLLVRFDEANSDFHGFADLATNGVTDDLRVFWNWIEDPCPFPCVGQGGLIGEFDLSGYRLDHIDLVVQSIEFEPPMPSPSEEFGLSFSISYEFYGEVIPEPTTLTTLFAGAGVLCLRDIWQRGNSYGP